MLDLRSNIMTKPMLLLEKFYEQIVSRQGHIHRPDCLAKGGGFIIFKELIS